MGQLATTKMSSKGQVVIPEAIRKELNLESGSQFMVVADGDGILLKNIHRPSMKDFDKLVKKTRAAVKAAGLTPKDLENAIKEVRREKRNENRS